MKAVIKLDVPDWQIGQEVSVYFKDTMMKKGICEKACGRWKDITRFFPRYECSECEGEGAPWMNFCPLCGADMREGNGTNE